MSEFYDLTPDQQVNKLKSLVRQALAAWGIEDAAIELLKYRENAVFSVSDTQAGAKYAIRVHRFAYHSDAELWSELTWMQALNKEGILTPPVIPTRDDKLFVVASHPDVPEPRQVDLLGWVDGEQIGTIENDQDISLEQIRQNYFIAGKLAARIHNQSEHWQRPQGFVRKHWDEDGLLGAKAYLGCFWELELLREDQRDMLLKAREKILQQLGRFGKESDHYGLAHADFLPENLLSDGDKVRIIDFDDCGFGWHIMDIATSLFFLLGEPAYDQAYAGLLEGYRSERDLPDEHLEYMPSFLLARGLTYLGWVHSRKETETAQEIGPVLLEGVCALAEDYLSGSQKA